MTFSSMLRHLLDTLLFCQQIVLGDRQCCTSTCTCTRTSLICISLVTKGVRLNKVYFYRCLYTINSSIFRSQCKQWKVLETGVSHLKAPTRECEGFFHQSVRMLHFKMILRFRYFTIRGLISSQTS